MDQVFKQIDTTSASIIGLYFSGEYCKYCKEFTPILIETYQELLANNIDIVYVSSDKTINQYDTYRSMQPWQSIAYSESELRLNLRKQFDIKTIPALLFFDVTHGNLIEANGRAKIQADSSNAIKDLIGSIISDYDSDASDF